MSPYRYNEYQLEDCNSVYIFLVIKFYILLFKSLNVFKLTVFWQLFFILYSLQLKFKCKITTIFDYLKSKANVICNCIYIKIITSWLEIYYQLDITLKYLTIFFFFFIACLCVLSINFSENYFLL